MLLSMIFGITFGILSVVSNHDNRNSSRIGIAIFASLFGIILGQGLYRIGFPIIYLLGFAGIPLGLIISKLLRKGN